MQGRWTIRKWDGGSEVLGDRTTGYTTTGDVPVVPCDDAAIERGIDALEASDKDYRYVSRSDIRAAVEAVLRAAGETP